MTDNIYLASIYRLTGVNFWESAKKLDLTMGKTDDDTPAKITAIPFYFFNFVRSRIIFEIRSFEKRMD